MARIDHARVLKVAEDLFAEAGAAGFGVRELARRAGVSPAWVTRYLGNRDELLGKLAEAYHGQLAAMLVGILRVAEATGKSRAETCGLIAAHFVLGDPARTLEANSSLMQTFSWIRITRRPNPFFNIPGDWYLVVGTAIGCRLTLGSESVRRPLSRAAMLKILTAAVLAVAEVVEAEEG